ncbi:phosphatidylethanolamine-binding protein, partial [Mycena pura]
TRARCAARSRGARCRRAGRPLISLALPRRWSAPLPAGIMPAYDEAVKLIRADARRVRAEVERAHRLLCGEEPGAEPVVGVERSLVEERLEHMREKLHILDVQSEVNLPEVRWSVANGMADMSVPSHRHLVEQRWRKDGDLDLLMERIHQMHVVVWGVFPDVPDVLPVLHPSLDLHLTARLLPVHFDALMHRNRAQRRVNTFKDVVPGNYLTPRQTRPVPKLYANVFHTDVHLYTMLMVDPDVPDEETRTFTTFLHWLKPNIPLSATHTGRIPLLNTHTRYVPPHPQRGTPYHRYVTLLLPQPPLPGQKWRLEIPVVPGAARLGFDVRAFARERGLNGAVGGGVHMFLKISQDIFLTVFDQELCNPGEWRANLHELLEKLQSTNAALTGLRSVNHISILCSTNQLGSVKLAIRDHEYPDHHIYFVKVRDGAGPLEEAQTSPEFATIPATNLICAEIFVEHVESPLLSFLILTWTLLNFLRRLRIRIFTSVDLREMLI